MSWNLLQPPQKHFCDTPEDTINWTKIFALIFREFQLNQQSERKMIQFFKSKYCATLGEFKEKNVQKYPMNFYVVSSAGRGIMVGRFNYRRYRLMGDKSRRLSLTSDLNLRAIDRLVNGGSFHVVDVPEIDWNFKHSNFLWCSSTLVFPKASNSHFNGIIFIRRSCLIKLLSSRTKANEILNIKALFTHLKHTSMRAAGNSRSITRLSFRYAIKTIESGASINFACHETVWKGNYGLNLFRQQANVMKCRESQNRVDFSLAAIITIKHDESNLTTRWLWLIDRSYKFVQTWSLNFYLAACLFLDFSSYRRWWRQQRLSSSASSFLLFSSHKKNTMKNVS